MPSFVTTGCQTYETILGLQQQQDELQSLRNEVSQLRSTVKSLEISEDSFKSNDAKVTFYTGLQSSAVFMHVYNFNFDNATNATQCILLTPFQDFVLFVMHLRLNLSFQYLVYSFTSNCDKNIC